MTLLHFANIALALLGLLLLLIVGWWWVKRLKRRSLQQTLRVLGIVAHELRTPVSGVGLVATSLEQLAERDDATSQTPANLSANKRLHDLSLRLNRLSTQINQQIDHQINQARMLYRTNATPQGAPVATIFWVGSEVRRAVAQYPFGAAREREQVAIDVVSDFCVKGDPLVFQQVITNLVCNALAAVLRRQGKRLQPAEAPGAICFVRIVVDEYGRALVSPRFELLGWLRPQSKRFGCVMVQDQGDGVPAHLAKRIFEPFFSTHHHSAHGLGLAFCALSLRMMGGSIRWVSPSSVRENSWSGASFLLKLPSIAPPRPSHPVCAETP